MKQAVKEWKIAPEWGNYGLLKPLLSGPLSPTASERCNKNGGGNRAGSYTEKGPYL